VDFYFFGRIDVKVSCADSDMGFVRGVVRVGSKSIKKSLEIAFIGQNIYASQLECVVVERGRQRPGNRREYETALS